MTKLNQVIAIEKGVKSRHTSEITEVYKLAQKPDLFNGFSRQYKKNDDSGEDLPPEKKVVQFQAGDLLRRVTHTTTELFDLTFRKDRTNCIAKADVTVDGNVIVKDAPVSYLLFLEKQLTDVRTFVGTLPTLDDAEEWEKDPNSGLFKSAEVKTHRTKKVQKSLVLLAPTAEHPGQAQLITDDVIVGYWGAIKQSGAIPKTERGAILERVENLLNAVKEARETANMQDVADYGSVGETVFDYLLPSA